MDVEDIPPGENFAQTINSRIAECAAFLVIIGPRWMDILRARSKEPQEDFVCSEIETALKRKAPIIPVLVGGTSMAELTDLPERVQELALHQAVELRDSTFKEDCTRLTNSLMQIPGVESPHFLGVKTRKQFGSWIVGTGILATVVLFLSYFAAGPWNSYRTNRAKLHQLLASAQAQADQADYETAFKTYQRVLDSDPANRIALERQVDVAMRWVRDFHVIAGEDQKAEDIAGPKLAGVISVLEAGLGRTDGVGARAADILSHLGWAHWLNQHIAYKEFGSAAENDLRRALRIDPANVFANAMLGNWLLQTGGDLREAVHHFDLALKTNKERALVREMQLGGMIYNDKPGVRQQLIKVANQMRLNAEPIPEEYGQRILSETFDPAVNTREALTETLSAVPPDQAWATYLWLANQNPQWREGKAAQVRSEFIHANVLELDGKQAEALALLRSIQKKLNEQGVNGRIADHVSAAIKRLSPLVTSAKS